MLTVIDKLHIRQANTFIERIQPKWSAITQRFFLYCIASVNENKEHFEVIKVAISDLPKILGYAENTNLQGHELKEIYDQLKKDSTVETIDEVLKVYKAVFLFDKLDFDTTAGVITIVFSQSMCRHLLQLGKKKKPHVPFTDIKYKEVIELRGTYATRLTELLHQYIKVGRRVFKLEDLRMLLSVPAGSYKVYTDFKRYVLDQAVNEINNNKNATITVSYIAHRVGRFIGEIEFIIKKRKKRNRADAEKELLEAASQAAAVLDLNAMNEPVFFAKYMDLFCNIENED